MRAASKAASAVSFAAAIADKLSCASQSRSPLSASARSSSSNLCAPAAAAAAASAAAASDCPS
eukprot:2874857-Pleurochrysis_carterae.AAC.1